MSNLLLIFTVVFVLVVAMACVAGIVVMVGNIRPTEDPPWRKRKAAYRASGTHRVFKDLH
ncbi:MAG TPA: hypothetical protein VMR02_14690 [Terracidiphilus sp.]|jgi:hypothetical protein|nr:hypothetical protein [Terracidiphilus sp.]